MTPRQARGATGVGGLPDRRRAHDAPSLTRAVAETRRLGFKWRMINNGDSDLSPELIDALRRNPAGDSEMKPATIPR